MLRYAWPRVENPPRTYHNASGPGFPSFLAMAPCSCLHAILYHDTCDGARKNTAWARPDEDTRLAAQTLTDSRSVVSPRDVPQPMSFPGPLVMPDDCLAIEPDTEPQTVHEYVNADYRNCVTPQRNVIYVFDVPDIAPTAAFAKAWQNPAVPVGVDNTPPPDSTNANHPSAQDIAAYTEAFYHGMPVRIIKDRFRLVKWESRKRRAEMDRIEYIGLEASASEGSSASVTQIRCRPSKDDVAAKGQLNLNDLLDGLQEQLPTDAYAAMLLMHHDLYEDEDDDFCCGRAYGQSRICVISTFRYHPKLGPHEGITQDHTWPNSHCREYVDDIWACVDDSLPQKGRRSFKEGQMIRIPDFLSKPHSSSPATRHTLRTAKEGISSLSQPPLVAASLCARQISTQRFKRTDWEETWLARACVVAVHELGHCFGLDHCVYYACAMQGTASVAEDTQQPPYLCPVCQAKVAYTAAFDTLPNKGRRRRTQQEVDRFEREWTLKQYAALGEFCDGREGGVMFKGFGAWLHSRMEEMNGTPLVTTEEPAHEPETQTAQVSKSASYFSDLVN